MDLNIWNAKDVIKEILKNGTDFLINSAVIINKENKEECRVYVEYDVGGYDNLKADEYYIPNCSDEDYKMLFAKLPIFRGFKEMRGFHSQDEYGINHSMTEFLYLIGRIW